MGKIQSISQETINKKSIPKSWGAEVLELSNNRMLLTPLREGEENLVHLGSDVIKEKVVESPFWRVDRLGKITGEFENINVEVGDIIILSAPVYPSMLTPTAEGHKVIKNVTEYLMKVKIDDSFEPYTRM